VRIVRVIARLNVGEPARHVVLLDRGLRARGHDTLLVHGSLDAAKASLEHPAEATGGLVNDIDRLYFEALASRRR